MPPDRSIIQNVFMELFARHDLKIPGEIYDRGEVGNVYVYIIPTIV